MTDSNPGCGYSHVTQPPLWEVYATLCDDVLFRVRVGWRHHRLVIRHLAHANCPSLAALELREIVAHSLFGAARRPGRQNALADVGQTLALLRANTLPSSEAFAAQAPVLCERHLGSLAPEPRRQVHRWVLRRVDTLRRRFFEPKKGSHSTALWGVRFVGAPGGDWYQQCLAMMDKGAVRAACRGDTSVLGAKLISLAL